mmetsp:Transcript_13627/g.42378  ORF Transcript_13627/g.42378 Transcript_13627/m.42378 type:complete len:219 (-) Transcript_13627:122-778(-)
MLSDCEKVSESRIDTLPDWSTNLPNCTGACTCSTAVEKVNVAAEASKSTCDPSPFWMNRFELADVGDWSVIVELWFSTMTPPIDSWPCDTKVAALKPFSLALPRLADARGAMVHEPPSRPSTKLRLPPTVTWPKTMFVPVLMIRLPFSSTVMPPLPTAKAWKSVRLAVLCTSVPIVSELTPVAIVHSTLPELIVTSSLGPGTVSGDQLILFVHWLSLA